MAAARLIAFGFVSVGVSLVFAVEMEKTDGKNRSTTAPSTEISIFPGLDSTINVQTSTMTEGHGGETDAGDTQMMASYFTVPILLVVGLFGNIMSVVVITQKEFRKLTMSIILVAVALSDTLLIVMQPHNKPYIRQLLNTDVRSYDVISCKSFYWFFRTAKMTSSWLIVLIASERLVAVWWPLKARVVNSKRNVIIAVLMVYVCIGSFNAAWSMISGLLDNGTCLPNKTFPQLFGAAKVFVVAGTMVYAIIPSCAILMMNVMIIGKLALLKRRRSNLTVTDNTRQQDQQTRMTAMLIGVTLAFIFLVIPNAVLQSVGTFVGFNPFTSKDHGLVLAREIIQTLEQLNYSINFYLYVLCSKPFRVVTARLLTCGHVAIKANDGHRKYESRATNVQQPDQTQSSQVESINIETICVIESGQA